MDFAEIEIAYHLVAVWLLHTLEVLMVCDFSDDSPGCVRDYGPHRVVTVGGMVSYEKLSSFQAGEMEDEIRMFLKRQRPVILLDLYDLEVYRGPHDATVYVSVALV